ncbi:MAG TPA: M56 family metallopeptidase [Haloferula sp.]
MNLLETVFEWVVSTTIRASLVAVAILAIQMMLRPWMPAKWRHPLWLPLLLVMLLPFVPALPVHIIPPRPAAQALPVLIAAPEATSEMAAVATTNAVAAAPRKKLPILPMLWLAGALVTAAAGIASYRSKLKAIRTHAVSPDASLQAEIEEARKAAGLSKTPLVWLSPEVESPAVSGLLRPLLLLPAAFPAAFTAAESRLILLHEFSHIKRRDLAQNWLLFALQSLHWFNPVIWFAFARVRLDRETACDARVLALDAGDRRSEYGHALLKMQELPPVSGLRLGFLGIFENVSGLRSRISDISRYRRSHPAWQAAACMLVAVIALFGSTRAKEQATETFAQASKEKPAPALKQNETEPLTGATYILNKTKAIVLPQVKFADTSMEEAIDFIRMKSAELDKAEPDPSRKGINLVIRRPRLVEGEKPKEMPRLTLEMKNVSMDILLAEVAKQTGTRYKVDDFALTFVPADEKDTPPLTREQAEARAMNAPPVSPKAVENLNKARNIVLGIVDFENVTLKEAVDFLNLQAKANSKAGPAPKITIGPNTKGDAMIAGLHLRTVPLSEALRYCAEAVKEKLTVTDEGLQIGK